MARADRFAPIGLPKALPGFGDIGDRPLGALVAAARYRIDRDGTDRVGR